MTPRLARLAVLLTVLGVIDLPRAEAWAQQPARPDTAKKTDLPLTASRTIDIDTDEGTWISLYPSPDGRMVVFDLLGDLYSVPIAGGPATQLTSEMAFDGPATAESRREVGRLHLGPGRGGERLGPEPRDTGDPADHQAPGQSNRVSRLDARREVPRGDGGRSRVPLRRFDTVFTRQESAPRTRTIEPSSSTWFSISGIHLAG